MLRNHTITDNPDSILLVCAGTYVIVREAGQAAAGHQDDALSGRDGLGRVHHPTAEDQGASHGRAKFTGWRHALRRAGGRDARVRGGLARA